MNNINPNNKAIKELNTVKLNIKSNNKTINWQNIAVCENYLIIKDEKIEIFEINHKENSAEFRLDLKIEEELEKIITIDINNIFFLLSASIMKFDVFTRRSYSVAFSKVSAQKTVPINRNQITALYFNEKIKLNKDDNNFYFGLMATRENGELHVSKELIKDNFNDALEIIFDPIVTFKKEIKHVELRLFYPNDDEKGYYIITVLSHLTGWYALIRISFNDYASFTEELKNAQWKILYDYSGKILKTCYSIHYDANGGHPISFISISDTLKMKYVKFNEIHDEEDLESFTRKEVEIDLDEEIKNFGDRGFSRTDSLVGIHHHSNIIYVSFKNRVYLFDINSKEIVTMKKFESETIRDIYIEDPEYTDDHNFYNLYLLSNRNVYYSKIETDFDAELYRIGSKQNMIYQETEEDVEGEKENKVIIKFNS